MYASGIVLTVAALASVVCAKTSWSGTCGATKKLPIGSYGSKAVKGHWKGSKYHSFRESGSASLKNLGLTAKIDSRLN